MLAHRRLPTIRQLQLVQALDEFKSISKVAQEMHISQPSVSIQLKKVSELIGMEIYQHRGQGIELTDAGKVLINNTHDIMRCMNNLATQLDDLKGLRSGTLKLCVVSTAKYFLPLMLGPFCKKHPLVDINLKIGNRNEVIQRLQANMDDFYFFSHYPENMNIVTTPFMDNELVVVAPENHELSLQEDISLTRLAHYPFIMREPGSGTRRSIEQFCREHQIGLNEKMTIESNEAIKHAVASGLGLSILSRHSLDYGFVPGVIRLNVEHFPIRSQWYLVSRKDRKPSLLTQTFELFMKNEGLDVLNNLTKNRA